MKNLKLINNLYLFVCLMCLSLTQAFAQADVVDKAFGAIKTGNAKNLAVHFNDLVELNIEEERSSYSKAQAEIVMGEFFKKYPIKNFESMHSGASKEGLRYAIGKYTYDGGSFVVYLVVKFINNKYSVVTLDFRED